MIRNLNKQAIIVAIFISLIGVSICHDEGVTKLKRGGVLKAFTQSHSISGLNFDQQIVVPLNLENSNYLYRQHSTGQLINESGRALIEVKVYSLSMFQAYLREEGSQELEILESIDGVHFFAYRQMRNRKFEVVLKALEYVNNIDIVFDESQQEYILKKNTTNYSIEVIPTEQRVCPFDCFGKGFCQPNGQCLCEEGYSQHYHCQTKTENKLVSFDKITRVFQQNAEEQNLKENEGVEEEWKYMNINLLFDDYVYKQIEANHSTHMKPQSVFVKFQYQSRLNATNHKLILLENNKSYRVLQKEYHSKENIFETVLEIRYEDFQIKSLINLNSAYPLSIGHKGYHFIEVTVGFNYRQTSNLFEICSLIFVLFFSIVLIYFFILILRRHKGRCLSQDIQQSITFTLDQSEIQLNIEQINQQIQSQMPIFQYQTPACKNLNGTHYECFICLNKYQDLEECRMTKCGHVFHKDCVDAWLQKHLVCPVDRMNLSAKF